MNDSIENLKYNLAWRWPRSFDRIEPQADGKVWAFFKKEYRDGYHKRRRKTVFYEVKIVFHPHPYEAGINWHFGKITFGGARLPFDHKNDVREQYRRVLKNNAYPEEKRNPYA